MGQRLNMVSLFNGILNFVGNQMPNPTFSKNNSGTILVISGRDVWIKEFILLPNGICQKVIVIARLEFVLAYFNAPDNFVSSCATRTPRSHSLGRM